MVVSPTLVTVSLPQPQTHLIHVEIRTPDLHAGTHEFFMPVWTPGSYLVREYSRHVESVEACDGSGQPLACRKVAKNRWAVELTAHGEVCLSYRVYARDLSVRTNFVDAQRAYWNGAATYLVAVDRTDAPLDIRVEPPAGWQVHTTLPKEGDAVRAQTLDAAVDSPFVVGEQAVLAFESCGVRHDCVFDGVATAHRERLVQELKPIVDAAASIFGGELPYEHYKFFVFADGSGSGGLEHAESCVVHVRRSSLRTESSWQKVIGLFAHEHFHVWNVKRIRPEGLATFDYEAENYSPDLWLSEGFTSYYQEVIPYAAGLFDRPYFLERLAQNYADVQSVPGRALQSVSESSFDAWIKLYRADESTRNTTVSYYSKGAVVAFCLDLLIQASSKGDRSLDDVMRGLWSDFRERGPGQSRDLVLACIHEAAGRDLSDEFHQLVDGHDDPPLDEWLQPFGLRFEPAAGEARASLGIRTKIEHGLLRVSSVERGSAGWAMGLVPDDELVAINSERVLPDDLGTTLREQYRPGDEVELQVFRRGLLTRVNGRLGALPSGRAKLVEEGGSMVFRAANESK